ncbi:hypothetical protein D0B32_28030 [Paraburkholderia sp. DHOC27]|nr:hypothetical protein D0B32_28030 [Paraburkholderia sp. DHOC27]
MCCLLAACLIPEKFSATADIQSDGTYNYTYKGTAVFALAAMQIKQKGPLSARDDASLKEEAVKATKPGETYTYAGDGRYNVDIRQKMKIGMTSSNTLDLFRTSRAPNGVITMTSAPLGAKDIEQLRQLDIRVDGTVDITLPSGAQVISQNATSTPGIFNKAYEWKIGDIAQRPVIQFKLAN